MIRGKPLKQHYKTLRSDEVIPLSRGNVAQATKGLPSGYRVAPYIYSLGVDTKCRERCLHRSALAIHCERISYILEITIYELLVKDIYASKKPLDIYFPAL